MKRKLTNTYEVTIFVKKSYNITVEAKYMEEAKRLALEQYNDADCDKYNRLGRNLKVGGVYKIK